MSEVAGRLEHSTFKRSVRAQHTRRRRGRQAPPARLAGARRRPRTSARAGWSSGRGRRCARSARRRSPVPSRAALMAWHRPSQPAPCRCAASGGTAGIEEGERFVGWSLAARAVPCSGCSSSGPGAVRPASYGPRRPMGDRACDRFRAVVALLEQHRAVELARAVGVRQLAFPRRRSAGAPPGARRCHSRKSITDDRPGRGCAWSSTVTVGVPAAGTACRSRGQDR